MQWDDQKCDVLEISKKMVKTNQDEQCIRDDYGVLTLSDEGKK